MPEPSTVQQTQSVHLRHHPNSRFYFWGCRRPHPARGKHAGLAIGKLLQGPSELLERLHDLTLQKIAESAIFCSVWPGGHRQEGKAE